MTSRLDASFFDQPCEDLAKALLGKKLVRHFESGERSSVMIVETEAYLGGEDEASHSYNGKKTDRNTAMYMKPGTAYVYNIYGMYTCLNISSKGDGAAVLLRAVDPVEGLEVMKKSRLSKMKSSKAEIKVKDIGSGPSKLTQALDITKIGMDQTDLTVSPNLWLEDGDVVDTANIITSHRIGLNASFGKWTNAPLRYYLAGNKSISVRDKSAEGLLCAKKSTNSKRKSTSKASETLDKRSKTR